MYDDAGTEPENIVDLGMVDVCYLNIFSLRYREDSTISRLMYKAQCQYFVNDGNKTYICGRLMSMLVG